MKPLTAALLALPLSLAACYDKDDPSASGNVGGSDAGGDGTDGSDSLDSSDGSDGSDGSGAPDADGDGWTSDEDCDDGDADINPAAAEQCDDVDRNCDGDPTAGAVDAQQGWLDDDGDGFGDPGSPVEACELPEDAVLNDGDCDDGDDTINPDALEVCDGSVDEDCDGDVDEDDSDLDVCDPTVWTGTYSGSFSLEVSALAQTDTCAGTGVAEVDAGDSPAVNLTITCAFAGVLTTFFPGSQTVTVEGDFDTPNTASGEVVLAGLGTDTWTGTFTSPDSLVVRMGGTVTVNSITADYTGVFVGGR